MKSVILYAGKHGYTKMVGEEIASSTHEIYAISEFKQSLHDYDKILFGSSLYAGMMRKELKHFINEHKEELMKKKCAIYVCGLNQEKWKQALQENFNDADLLFQKQWFAGGCIDPDQLKFFEKKVLKMVLKDQYDGKKHVYKEESIYGEIRQWLNENAF